MLYQNDERWSIMSKIKRYTLDKVCELLKNGSTDTYKALIPEFPYAYTILKINKDIPSNRYHYFFYVDYGDIESDIYAEEYFSDIEEFKTEVKNRLFDGDELFVKENNE